LSTGESVSVSADSAVQERQKSDGWKIRIISIVRGKKPGFSEKPGFWPFKPQVIERIRKFRVLLFSVVREWGQTNEASLA
jgi:hypothetical protein